MITNPSYEWPNVLTVCIKGGMDVCNKFVSHFEISNFSNLFQFQLNFKIYLTMVVIEVIPGHNNSQVNQLGPSDRRNLSNKSSIEQPRIPVYTKAQLKGQSIDCNIAFQRR